MVKLTKIYTRTGDAGETGLGDASRVSKTDARVEAYGDVDETNAAVGFAVACVPANASEQAQAIRDLLCSMQQDLFDVGADLCVPVQADEGADRLRVTAAQVQRLEKAIDTHNATLGPLMSFVLPGGTELAARLHIARTVARRAERRVVALCNAEPKATNPETLRYLNRLSDLLFVLARAANVAGPDAPGPPGSPGSPSSPGDVLWVPGANRE